MSDRLAYRRQFLLAREAVPELAGWRYEKIDDLCLHVHPDLEFAKAETARASLYLMGYLFDPRQPGKGNVDILHDILRKTGSASDLFLNFKGYVGRYAILYKTAGERLIFHDAMALREIYHCLKPNRVVCGSQPNLLSEYSRPKLGRTGDKDILEYFENDLKLVRSGRAWIGPQTLYEDIEHLMTGDFLDIGSLKPARYWPNRKLSRLDVDEAAEIICDRLKGVLRAAASRYRVMMAVTSGVDSRSLLAAARDIADELYFYINLVPPLTDRSSDIRIPKIMMARLGLPFHPQDAVGPVDEEFRRIFLNNTFASTDLILPFIYHVFFKHHQDKVNLLGVGEIGRGVFGRTSKDLDGYELARKLKYKKSRYVTRQCEEWLRGKKEMAAEYGIDLMALFALWSLAPNWGAVGNSESDIAMEEFNPYDSHEIYETMLSVAWADRAVARRKGLPLLYERMFLKMWPELLDYPFNPPDSVGDVVMTALKKARLYGFFQALAHRYDRWRYSAMNRKTRRA